MDSWEMEFGDWRQFLNTCKDIGYHYSYPYPDDEEDMIQSILRINDGIEWFLYQTTWPKGRQGLEHIKRGVYDMKTWTVFQTPDHAGVVFAFSEKNDAMIFKLSTPL
jgi:hypothetical protein